MVWATSETTKRIRKIKKQIFAMPAAAIATPPNPKIAAKSAIRKKVSAQFSMFVSFGCFGHRFPVIRNPVPLRKLAGWGPCRLTTEDRSEKQKTGDSLARNG
jgi:hypothetical protein